MFAVDLQTLVRGIRANKGNETKYISEQLQAIKEELRTGSLQKKAVAVQKLTYLQMFGYDISWASFSVIEVMASPRFSDKRVAYLAASQSFTEATDVLMLTTNLIKKDFSARNMYETGLALNCLANICTPGLGKDLAADVLTLLASSKPYVRKRAVLALYKVFVQFPESLRPSYPRLKERLGDEDDAVKSAAVVVICELARKNPGNFITLSPKLLDLLSSQMSSQNNWMLIKVIKLFGSLAPLDIRLAKLLLEPLTRIINTTPSVSVLYEAIQTCVAGLSKHGPTMRLCCEKLKGFVESPDANLKYLGLATLRKLMAAHPKAVLEHQNVVLRCLDDPDESIRARALELVDGMVSAANIFSIVKQLLAYVVKYDGQYRTDLIAKITCICSANQYENITDFDWYTKVLVELAKLPGLRNGKALAHELLDIVVRVRTARCFAVQQLADLVEFVHGQAEQLASGAAGKRETLVNVASEDGIAEVLMTAAYAVGEYNYYVEQPLPTMIDRLLDPRNAALPPHVQAAYVHNAFKLLAAFITGFPGLQDEYEEIGSIAGGSAEEVEQALQLFADRVVVFTASPLLEVQERACLAAGVLELFGTLGSEERVALAQEFATVFGEPLLPVSKAAQSKVKVPAGLDLDEPVKLTAEEEEVKREEEAAAAYLESVNSTAEESFGLSAEERAEFEQMSADEQVHVQSQKSRHAPSAFLLSGQPEPQGTDGDADADSAIPVETLSEDMGRLQVGSPKRRTGILVKRKAHGKGILAVEQAPEEADDGTAGESGASHSAGGTAAPAANTFDGKCDALAKISLDAPLREDEALPTQTYHSAASPSQQAARLNAPKTPRLRKLCECSALRVAYEIKTNQKEPKKVLITLHMTALAQPVSSFVFGSSDDATVQMVRTPAFLRIDRTLPAGRTGVHQLLFTFPSAAKPLHITGEIKAKADVPFTLPFAITVPASSFVTPTPMEKAQFGVLVKELGSRLTMASATVSGAPSFAALCETLCNVMHLGAVTPSSAASKLLCGKTIQGEVVCVLAKAKGTAVAVDFKATNADLAKSLAAEVKALF